MELDFASYSNLAFAGVAVGVALVVLASAPGRACNRFFAAWLGLRGALTGFNQFVDVADPGLSAAFLSLSYWSHVVLAGLLLAVLIVHTRALRTRWANAIAAGALAVATVLAFLPSESPAIVAASLMPIVQAVVACVFVVRVMRLHPVPDMDWLLAMALLPVAIIDGLLPISATIAQAGIASLWTLPAVWAVSLWSFLGAGLVALVAGFVLVFGTWRIEPLVPRRAGVLVLVLAALAAATLPHFLVQREATIRFAIFMAGLLRLALPLVAAYGLVKYRIFVPGVKLRKGINGTIVAGIFFMVYLVAGETLEAIVGARFGNNLIGIGAAMVLVLAIVPIERAVRKMTDGVVPQPATAEDSLARRQRAYREQLELAWMDGRLDLKERLMLDRVKVHLGLTAADVDRVEAPFMRRLAQRA